MAARKESTTEPEVSPDATPVVATLCGCGCGASAKPGRSFVQGHDARFHGLLARALRDGATTVVVNGADVDIASEYNKRGWVPAQPRKSRKLTPAERVAKLEAQLAEAREALGTEAS